MPFSVSQWPNSPDPRKPDFAIHGWNFGQVPPFSWNLSTTGATGIYGVFNGGVLLRNLFASPSSSSYAPNIPPPDNIQVNFDIFGFQTPQPGPPVHTIDIFFEIVVFTLLSYTGSFRALFPVAIAIQEPIPLVTHFPVSGSIPNPMLITPLKWDAQ